MITINASWFWLFIFLLYFISFFFKKEKIIDLKKASWPKLCNIIFLFLIKVGSIGPVGQQINFFCLKYFH